MPKVAQRSLQLLASWWPVVVMVMVGLMGYAELRQKVNQHERVLEERRPLTQQFIELAPVIVRLDHNLDRLTDNVVKSTVSMADLSARLSAVERELNVIRETLRSQRGATQR